MSLPDDESLSTEDRMVVTALKARRPSPTPAFRGSLGRRLVRLDPGYGHRPARLRAHAAFLVGAGSLGVLLGLLVSAGVI